MGFWAVFIGNLPFLGVSFLGTFDFPNLRKGLIIFSNCGLFLPRGLLFFKSHPNVEKVGYFEGGVLILSPRYCTRDSPSWGTKYVN